MELFASYRDFRETGPWSVADVTAAMSVVQKLKYKNVSLDRWELKSFFIIDAQRKRHFKREIGFFQSSSRLLNSLTLSNVGEFSGSWIPKNSKRGKICRRSFTSSIKKKWRLQSCSDGKEMYKKAWCTCKVVVVPIIHLVYPLKICTGKKCLQNIHTHLSKSVRSDNSSSIDQWPSLGLFSSFIQN